ncbi:hypothetical protein RHMOL_Rhmol02G0155600 [Rhododendron molle]|uniref:Uncharacterized protein n=1 Tax=Rhododendron molle TaxID=49168 RepID=A0ACC0PS47_RHOML|nr:hypothetical protein RHMOL_Rhmol02G0155600 [Rhododendron molle]
MVSGESSSSQSAIEVSNGIPSVLVDLPNLDEVQPTTTSEVVPILASEIVVKDSVGIVVKGPVVHAPSNQANGGQRAACAQSIQGQVVTNEKLKLGELTSSQKNVLGLRAPPSPVLQQVLQEDSDDSEADLLEVLEGVVRSVINDPSNFQKATTSPTSIANNPTVITPSKQPTKAAKKASKAACTGDSSSISALEMGSSMVKAQMVLTPRYQAMLISRSQSILATVRWWHGGGFVHGRLFASRTEMGSFMVGGGFIQYPQKWPVMVSLYTSEKSTDEGRTQQRWFLLSRTGKRFTS